MIVVSIITKGNEVLVGKLKQEKIKDFGGLKYSFPGGNVETAERFEEAVVREAKEETGLDVELVISIGSRLHPKTNMLITYYHCEVIGGELNANSDKNDDIEELIWVPTEKLGEYMPTLFPVVDKYLKGETHDTNSDLSE